MPPQHGSASVAAANITEAGVSYKMAFEESVVKVGMFFKFVLDIAHLMFKNYGKLRKDVLQIVLSVIFLHDMSVCSFHLSYLLVLC